MNPNDIQAFQWIIGKAKRGNKNCALLCDFMATDTDGRLTAYILTRVGTEVILKRRNKRYGKGKIKK